VATSIRKKLILFLSITAVLAQHVMSSQTIAAPAVSVTRNPALFGPVWPGDFNGDGRTDLLASDAPPNAGGLLVALGSGTGSFGAPIKSSFQGSALGVSDFNGDGKLDATGTAFFDDVALSDF
jgi:VCBS repeat protein